MSKTTFKYSSLNFKLVQNVKVWKSKKRFEIKNFSKF